MKEQDLNCSGEKSYYPIMADFATKVTKIPKTRQKWALKKPKLLILNNLSFNNMVGATGFEPATAWSQTRSATGLRYTPLQMRTQSYGLFSVSANFFPII